MALYLGSPTVNDTIQPDYMKGFRDGAIFIQKHKNDTYRYGIFKEFSMHCSPLVINGAGQQDPLPGHLFHFP
jgi:hypothetical protein